MIPLPDKITSNSVSNLSSNSIGVENPSMDSYEHAEENYTHLLKVQLVNVLHIIFVTVYNMDTFVFILSWISNYNNHLTFSKTTVS